MHQTIEEKIDKVTQLHVTCSPTAATATAAATTTTTTLKLTLIHCIHKEGNRNGQHDQTI